MEDICYLSETLSRRYWAELSFAKDDVIELDSETAGKFSRHLIIRLPGHAFENNAAAGSFINRIMARPEVCQDI